MDKPIPDGRIVMVFNAPIVDVQHDPLQSRPVRDMRDCTLVVYFHEIKGRRYSPHGLRIDYEDRHELNLYANMLSYEIHYNSQKYRDDLRAWQLQHDHGWIELPDDLDLWCPECQRYKFQLDAMRTGEHPIPPDRSRSLGIARARRPTSDEEGQEE